MALDCGQRSMRKYENHKERSRLSIRLAVSIFRWSLHYYENRYHGGKLIHMGAKNYARASNY